MTLFRRDVRRSQCQHDTLQGHSQSIHQVVRTMQGSKRAYYRYEPHCTYSDQAVEVEHAQLSNARLLELEVAEGLTGSKEVYCVLLRHPTRTMSFDSGNQDPRFLTSIG
jgi:hypothetical protein